MSDQTPRRLSHLKRPKPTPPEGGGGTAPPGAGKKDKKPAPTKVTFACGHQHSVGLFTGKICPQCRSVAAKKRGDRNLRVGLKKYADAAAAKHDDRGRLPDGAWFSVTYDADTRTWSGTLRLNNAPVKPDGLTFHGTNSALFKLLWELDDQYRRWAAGRGTQENVPPAVAGGGTAG